MKRPRSPGIPPQPLKEFPDEHLISEMRRRGYEYSGREFIKKVSYKKHPFEIDREALVQFYKILRSRELLVKHAATEAIWDWVKKYSGG